jgi:hypothetical protein
MRVMREWVFFKWITSDSLSRISSQTRIFEGAILHDELSMSINILSILMIFEKVHEQKCTLCVRHNNAPQCKY